MNASLIQYLFCTFKYASEGQVEVKVKFCLNCDEEKATFRHCETKVERIFLQKCSQLLKSRSEHTLEAGIDKYCLASCDMRGNRE